MRKTNRHNTFPQTAAEAAFLLGGIGTGNVSIGARGELRDWELFNRPGKGVAMPYTFFAIWSRSEGKTDARVLESRLQPPYSLAAGFPSSTVAGLPRFATSTLWGEYPLCEVTLSDPALPYEVKLEAHTPMIPLNPQDSGIPGAVLRYTVTNHSKQPIEVSLSGSLYNPVGDRSIGAWKDLEKYAPGENYYREQEGALGLFMGNDAVPSEHFAKGSMALMTKRTQGITVSAKPQWLRGGWWDGIQDFWDDFADDGKLEPESFFPGEGNAMHNPGAPVGSLAQSATIPAGGSLAFSFILSWHFPHRVKSWYEDSRPCCGDDCGCECGDGVAVVNNHYSLAYKDAWAVGLDLVKRGDKLEEETRKFHKALWNSTMPDYVLDAAASNMVVLRSTTCFWLDDGYFFGWEGCHDKNGCCDGNCTHVWNYAQTMAFLYPTLEQAMRRIEFTEETAEDGNMSFRARKHFGDKDWNFHPAADGQMGTIVRLYREWMLSGDTEFLKQMWPGAQKALDFAYDYWDKDSDGVLDSQQHNTYDIEFYGPNSLVNSLWFAALKAGAKMAEAMGDTASAKRYMETAEKGAVLMDKMLWGGEYYIQQIEDVNAYRYQYGDGCLSDQLLGQLMAHVAGVGYVLPQAHVAQAVKSIYNYNFKTEFYDHHSVQRTYALNGEEGLLLCTWPTGGRPKLPFVYSDEVWTGIEYQVAAHLIYEGHVEDGLRMVKAVRERHDGVRRNPWNEVECGHHYARSMASWAVWTALTGFQADLPHGKLRFASKVGDGEWFFSCGKGWGVAKQNGKERSIDVLGGSLDGVDVIWE